MRYWIWWNDLVQGPFEAFELSALAAFSEELLVCLDGRTDWLPAGRIADLSPALESWKAKQNFPPPPPPPPPSQPPRTVPLQGEFFSTPPEQKFLFEPPGENKGPFDYVPLTTDSLEEWVAPAVSMPIRFVAKNTNTLTVPTPEALIQKPDLPEWEYVPEPMRDSIPEPETIIDVEFPPAKVEPTPTVQAQTKISLEAAAPPREQLYERMADTPQAALPPHSISLWPWVLGLAALTALALFGGSKWADYSTSRAAIALSAARTVRHIPKPPIPQVVNNVVPKTVKAIKQRIQPKIKPLPVHHEAPPLAAVPPKVDSAREPPRVEGPSPTSSTDDPWKDRQQEAIDVVMKSKILSGKLTIGTLAETILEQMHDKELLHAMETGERLYLPDKMNWSALREEGARYRVYLNFSALQAGGMRVQTRSYPFVIDLIDKQVRTDDAGTQGDFLSATEMPNRGRQDAAKDMDNILGGVDGWNKQKLRAMVVRGSKTERKASEKTIQEAREKVRKSIVYFRTKYPESALQNGAKAYSFAELLK